MGVRGQVLGIVALGACAPTVDPDDTDTDTDAADTDVVGEDGLRFVAVDNGVNRLVLVDQIRGGGWSVLLPPGPRDVARVGDALYASHAGGFVKVALADGATLARVDGFAGVQSALPLDGGTVLLASQSGADVVLREVDDSGAVASERTLTGYGELRLVRRTASGNVLLTTDTDGYRVVEVDGEGEVVWSAPLPGKGYVALREGELTYATTGGDARLVAIDADGQIARSWGGAAAHPDAGLVWASGFQHLTDDAVLLTNWLGHGDQGTAPHLFLLDENDTILWSWEDHEAARQVTNVLVLAAQGYPAPRVTP